MHPRTQSRSTGRAAARSRLGPPWWGAALPAAVFTALPTLAASPARAGTLAPEHPLAKLLGHVRRILPELLLPMV